jgi:hypothetical protein
MTAPRPAPRPMTAPRPAVESYFPETALATSREPDQINPKTGLPLCGRR